MPPIRLELNGSETVIEATRQGDRFRVSFAGTTATLRLLHTGDEHRKGTSFVLERELPDGTCQRIRAVGHADGDRRQMWVNGRAFTYRRVRSTGLATADKDLSHSLSATIPSVVSEVLVNVGDDVTIGDKLVLLESMKMIIPIQAPCDGRITRIHCAAGDAVQPGVQLVEIETADGSITKGNC
jgi:biotin carboxyl carrier protein